MEVSIVSMTVVHARKKLAQERQFVRQASSARAIALSYLELHIRSKIFVSEMQFLVVAACKNVSFKIKQDEAEL